MAALKYDATFPDRLRQLAEENPALGFTNQQIADCLGCSIRSVISWYKKYYDFHAAIDDIKGDRNLAVENAMYQCCIGYEFTETKEVWEGGICTRREVTTKRTPPTPVLIMYWLQNRMPDRWKNVSEHKHGGSLSVHFDKEDAAL